MDLLQRVRINGFRSLKSVDLELNPLNVLIGANGSGKSNLISFFKLLNELIGGRLQEHVAKSGRATSILHLGPRVTPQFDARLEFLSSNGVNSYLMRMFHAAGDTLVFAQEDVEYLQQGYERPKVISLGVGHLETKLHEFATDGDTTAKVIRHRLGRCRVFHFHDTSPFARVRGYAYRGDDRWLMPDAANLAPVLLRLRDQEPLVYQRILRTIRLVAPYFDDFELTPPSPDTRDVILNWRQHGSDLIMGPHQLSDGTLRAICLISLLLQPEDSQPDLILVDEPELGLHPYALNLIAALFRSAAMHTQIMISTQSSAFLDNFDPADIIVVERDQSASSFRRLDPTAMQAWLEDYSLGEVWEKNVFGGGPC